MRPGIVLHAADALVAHRRTGLVVEHSGGDLRYKAVNRTRVMLKGSPASLHRTIGNITPKKSTRAHAVVSFSEAGMKIGFMQCSHQVMSAKATN